MKAFIAAAWRYSGLEFIAQKFLGKPIEGTKRREPPSGALWAIGIYFAVYGFAYQQYSSAVEFEKLLQTTYEPVPAATENRLCGYMWEYETIVTDVPFEPGWRSPPSIWWSLFSDRVPSTDSSLLRARKLEEISRIVLLSARPPYIEEWERPFYMEDEEALTLSEPYHTESIAIFESGNVVYIERDKRDEHEVFANALTSDEIGRVCLNRLKNEPENPYDSIVRNACTDIIFSRACQETRSKLAEKNLTDATREKIRQSVSDLVVLPEDFELRVRTDSE